MHFFFVLFDGAHVDSIDPTFPRSRSGSWNIIYFFYDGDRVLLTQSHLRYYVFDVIR
jgi:hypothetical protein